MEVENLERRRMYYAKLRAEAALGIASCEEFDGLIQRAPLHQGKAHIEVVKLLAPGCQSYDKEIAKTAKTASEAKSLERRAQYSGQRVRRAQNSNRC